MTKFQVCYCILFDLVSFASNKRDLSHHCGRQACRHNSDYNLMIEFSRKRERLLESSLAENLAFRQKMEQEEQKTPILHPQNGAIKSLLENLLLQAKEQRVSYETENIRDTPRFLVESLDDSMDLQ